MEAGNNITSNWQKNLVCVLDSFLRGYLIEKPIQPLIIQ